MIQRKIVTSISAAALLGSLGMPVAFAQSDDLDLLEEVVTIGSRTKPRSVTESPVPVDVISARDLAQTGSSDMLDMLKGSVPSFNVHDQPISDAASMIRPVNMRGLSSDSTLILFNGKRRHRASVIAFQGGGLNDGAQGPDISVIPSIALKQVEILRDGAAAQYGSDAIAGVMNFVLKDDAEGGALEVKTGQFYEGDGQTTTIAGNYGMAMTDSGFLNLSFQMKDADATSRSVQRPDAQALIDAGNTAVAVPAQIWGSPIIENDMTLFANFGIDLKDGTEIYAFGNYSNREVDGGFYYRNPNGRGGVYTYTNDNGTPGDEDDDFSARLIADMTDDMSGNCPNTLIPGDPADDAIFNALNPDVCFGFKQIIPGGYTPRFVGNITDTSFTAGRRGEFSSGFLEDWNFDLSGSVGRNESEFGLNNTINPSFGPDTKRNFDTGAYIQLEKTINFDLQKQMGDTSVAMGTEYREESFQIVAGEGMSWQVGPLAEQGFNIGSHGFAGFSIDSAGTSERSNYALYLDVENQTTDDLMLGGALRYENFNTFGDTINYKVVFNWQLSDNIAWRGSHSTGFRAPTLGQASVVNTQTSIVGGQLTQAQTLPAPKLGEAELQPEESVNFATGLVMNFGGLDVTVDAYFIEVTDRIALTDNATPTTAQRAAMAAAGVPNPELIGQINYFANDFDTETTGLDVVATYGAELFGGGTDFSLAYNWTTTEVVGGDTSCGGSFVGNKGEICKAVRLERGLPEHRASFTMSQKWENVSAFVRTNYYGEYVGVHADWFGEQVGTAFTVDLEATYHATQEFSFTAGASNLFDQEAAKIDGSIVGEDDSVLGGIYYETSPYGIGGGFYYLKASYEF
ncbi:TonB-dependent receptor plug domain-containing protein [Simiduia aestuariiviva]|uniref:Iron complex outermembrane receptor protein n=1 Tax=Simiduia aestuariiviva TaxID=1510459 RepID=A0A839UQL9_9GAMM|nr:TonB-dependent receptor [Simiduia aestuariiviva]MBB3167665.1 iron complex outermembrane receptor protein [Simiduia aestuariiviva]